MSQYDDLKRRALLLPMTDEQQAIQRLDFVYGNLACSSRHRPLREAFELLAEELRIPWGTFVSWADTKEWWKR
jgi:hypothetical protein